MNMLLRKNLLFILFAFVLFFACRKTEKVFTKEESAIEKKFFKTSVSTDPIVTSVSANIKRQNEKRNFVNKLSEKAGLPNWDKAAIVEVPGTALTKLTKADSNVYQVFIPFVKENTNYVNAVLIVLIQKKDTAFKLVYGSQYARFGFKEKEKGKWNAKDVFHVFALFNKQVFGHKKFLVKDKRLSPGNTIAARDSFRVNFIDSASLKAGGRFISYTACSDVEVEVPCKAFRTESEYICYQIINYCTTYYVTIFDPVIGGDTFDPNGGGGDAGGTGGGGIGWENHDPCQSDPNAPATGFCDPGWSPIGEYQFTPNDIRVWNQIEQEDVARAPMDCQGTGRLGNENWRGVLEHWIIQLDYLSTNNYPFCDREYQIPFSGPGGFNAGYADIVNKVSGEIFEIKPPTQLIAGIAEVNNYVLKANQYCTGSNGPATTLWRQGVNYATRYFPAKDPTKLIEASLGTGSPGVIQYKYVDKNTVPQPYPVVVPASVLDKLKELVRRLKENIPEFRRIIAEYMSENPDLVNYIKGAAVGAAVGIIVGTIVEDIITLGGGIADDLASFLLAYKIVRFAWAL
jgi:hypothetical protein